MDAAVVLAGQVVAALAPYLPYLGRAGQAVAEHSLQELDAHAWEFAQKLWGHLRPKIDERPAMSEAAAEVATHPDDEDSRAALRVQMRTLLNKQPELADQLRKLFAESSPPTTQTVTATQRSVAVGGNVSDSPIVIGDRNQLNR